MNNLKYEPLKNLYLGYRENDLKIATTLKK